MAKLGLPLQDFTTLVRNMAAAMTAASTRKLDFAVGTILRAVIEANASVALWLQWLILQVLAISRAATSNGADLDSWMADFGVARLAATAAHGTVVLSRLTPGLAATIAVGTSVRTADAAERFSVVADTANPAWTGTAYTLAASAVSVAVPVQADRPGTSGNLAANTLSVLATAIPGVDGVNNPLGTLGGLDAESDASLRGRFTNFLDSRSRATAVAISYAVQSVRQGLRFVISENQLPNGTPRIGCFVVTVDDGSGALPPAMLTAVTEAIDAVRPVGSVFSVQPPSILAASIVLNLRLATTGTLSDVAGPVSDAVSAWVARLPIGAPLPRSRLIQLAFAAAPSVIDVTSVLINGAAADVAPDPAGLVQLAGISVGATT